jgi:hypothetical protein
MIRYIALAGLVMASAALADSPAGFTKRFQLLRDAEGKLVSVRLKTLSPFRIAPYLQHIRSDLLGEQARWNRKTAREMELEIDRNLFAMGLNPYEKGGDRAASVIKASLLNVPRIPVERTFSQLGRAGFLAEFERRLNEDLLGQDLATLAKLDDPRFFYQRTVTWQAVRWALGQAKRHFSEVPLLNLVTYIIVEARNLVVQQKHFHHSMLLHYLEHHSPEELGMTPAERQRTLSSVYEYRIRAYDLDESNRAARTWSTYGQNKFDLHRSEADRRFRGLSQRFPWGKIVRLNFAFAEVQGKTTKKVYNLLVKESVLTSKAAMAYDPAAPERIRQHRARLRLAQLGIGFLPFVPGWLKDVADEFISSFHEGQRRWEGALVPYLEARGLTQVSRVIYRQNLNPYLP